MQIYLAVLSQNCFEIVPQQSLYRCETFAIQTETCLVTVFIQSFEMKVSVSRCTLTKLHCAVCLFFFFAIVSRGFLFSTFCLM